MSRLTDLISKAKATDLQLGADLEREFRALSSRMSFGLNFERHKPEAVELPNCPIRKGNKVRVLPPRGTNTKGDRRLWQVKAIQRGKKEADLELLGSDEAKSQTVALDDLVVVAGFGDTIYPGLISTGKVSRAEDNPWHIVINGENYHALKALTWTHRGKIDAIYIDPPYNTRDKDWKYNNDYVDADDLYRHSKWLAMMERRLLIAKDLLNPADSVLIVTIDEKEYLRLGLLLDQLFPEATFQMASTVIAPQGSQRPGRFSRVEEFIFFGFFGEAKAIPTGDAMIATTDEEITSEVGGEDSAEKNVTWDSLIRRGTDATRASREEMFYPIIIDRESRRVIEVGHPLGAGTPIPQDMKGNDEIVVQWPIRSDGTEGRWQLGRDTFIAVLEAGMARVGRTHAVTYLKGGTRKQVLGGEIVRKGSDKYGYPVYKTQTASAAWPRTLWNKRSHNASVYGSTLLRSIIPGRKFPFPKSLYAVEDTLRFFIAKKNSAVVLDFFSGSGTTAHAVMRLNKQYGGQRQCISVTNNEVAADEQKALLEKGLRPGDQAWEAQGICDYITKPRVKAAITGKTPDGNPIKGEYKFTDEFPMADGFEENAEFFTLTYETPVSVSYQTAFSRIAPLLWLRAGSVGRRIEKLPSEGWDVADAYGLLIELDRATDFLSTLRKAKDLRVAYIVTDDERCFQSLARRLPEGVEPVRLYESYLTNFAFANGGDA